MLEPRIKEDRTRKRWEEQYCIETHTEAELMEEIRIMEAESQWVPEIVSKDLRVFPLLSPMEAASEGASRGLDLEITFENAVEGSKLILEYQGQSWNISGIGRTALYRTAKLWGASLGRLPPLYLAQNLNNSLSVAQGRTLMLIRQEKIMALHSDSSYCIMPISTLMECARKSLRRYGTVVFEGGYHSNSYTAAVWSLPDLQDDVMTAYQEALRGAASHNHAVNFMPVVRFSSSDTAYCAAALQPMFQKPNGSCFVLGSGISVKHEGKSGRSGFLHGTDLFQEKAKVLYAKFEETTETLRRMAQTELYHPVNACVGMFNWLNRGQMVIPRKYADTVREELENFAVSTPIMSMHDVYLSMTECIGLAKENGVSQATQLNIEEGIAKILTLHWNSFDVGGTVAWGDKQPI